MCLVAIAWRSHPDYPIVLVGNRDEYFARPTADAAFWSDHPEVLGGRDLQAGGTWMGVRKDLRFAVVTNFRDPATQRAGAASRGQLPVDFLTQDDEPVVFARRFQRRGADPASLPNDFNLVFGNSRQAWYAATRSRMPIALTQGIHGLSNGLLDEPWPKVERLKLLLGGYLYTVGGFKMLIGHYAKLPDERVARSELLDIPQAASIHFDREVVTSESFGTVGSATIESVSENAFTMLSDPSVRDDEELPSTGVPIEWERRLSAAFIQSPDYGTRAQTVFVARRDGAVRFEERRFGPDGQESGRTIEEWTVDPALFSAAD